MGKGNYGKAYNKKRQTSKGLGQKGGGAPIRSGKIKASHILVEKFTKAQELYEDIQAGENFENIARQYSTCSSRKKGGNLGEFAKGDMVLEFWKACSNLKIKEISNPIKTKFGYHIIKRTG